MPIISIKMTKHSRKTPKISVKIHFWSRITTELGKNSKFTAFCTSGSKVTTRLHLKIIRFHSLCSEMHSHLICGIKKYPSIISSLKSRFLMFCELKHIKLNFVQTLSTRFGQEFEVEVQAKY